MQEFECTGDKKCIPIIEQCNGENNCQDDSDEKDCPVRSICNDNSNCKDQETKESKCQTCTTSSVSQTICGIAFIDNNCIINDDCCTGFCFKEGNEGTCKERGKTI